MARDEAPRLTRNVTLLLMLVVFLLCYGADQLKCRQRGRTSWCLGEPAYICDNTLCHDKVRGTADVIEPATLCKDKGEATLLLHVLEVGPPIALYEARKKGQPNLQTLSLADAVLQTLAARGSPSKDDGSSSNATSSLRERLFGDTALHDVAHDANMQPVFAEQRKSTQVLYRRDIIRVWPPGTSAEQPLQHDSATRKAHRDATFATALHAALPSYEKEDKTRRGVFALQRHFPVLYATLDHIAKHRDSAGGGGHYASDNTGCNVLNIVFYILLSPDSDTGFVATPDQMGEEWLRQHAYVRSVVTRLLSRKKRFRRHMNSVWFVSVPFGFAAHAFADLPNASLTSSSASSSELVPALHAIPRAMSEEERRRVSHDICITPHNVAGGVAAASTTPLRSSELSCNASCATYLAQDAAIASAGRSLYDVLSGNTSALAPSTRTRLMPYKDCYYNVTATMKHTETLRDVYYTCAHLTRLGLQRFAECLV